MWVGEQPAPMQPRRQPPAPGSRDPRAAGPKLALLLWFVLQGAAAAAAAAPAEPEGRAPAGEAGDPTAAGLPRGILQQAARAALHFFNFRAASPSALRVLGAVHQGRARVDPQKGCQVELVFSTESYDLEAGGGRGGKCSARVFFRNQKPRPAVNVTCTRLVGKEQRLREDRRLYARLRQLHSPFRASLPDSHGRVEASLRPIWDLAFLGSSYVMWEKTTQFSQYYLAQLRSVNHWKTSDGAIDFDYTVLLHEFPTQEILPCGIHLVWYPGKPLKVKYQCESLQTPEEASGTVEGSAAAPTELTHL
ncbi:retinoic acid receptor responder protein 1 [Perognathus longimembris pacificus]|uniref:retinoic acid receptor responder protein 1 n=1 Tax=Perognathus longimembris pacificus TaxID=214514 RepID=UPI002018F747|nr:retinoic acid receptor responder protein 1 [Perognathus longimembris pacificus]